MFALPDLLTCLQSSVFTIIVTHPSKSIEVHVPFLDALLLLSVYDSGSLSYYKLHGAGVGILNVFLIHSYVTLRISFGYGCRMCIEVRSS
jgi:hypothetical protein